MATPGDARNRALATKGAVESELTPDGPRIYQCANGLCGVIGQELLSQDWIAGNNG